METIRTFVNEYVTEIIVALVVVLSIGIFFVWAGSGKESNYPIQQRLITESTNFKGVELTSRAKSNCTNEIYICYTEDGTGAVLSGKDLEKSGLYIREIRHELKDQDLYAPEFWQNMEERGDIYDTIFVIDSTK